MSDFLWWRVLNRCAWVHAWDLIGLCLPNEESLRLEGIEESISLALVAFPGFRQSFFSFDHMLSSGSLQLLVGWGSLSFVELWNILDYRRVARVAVMRPILIVRYIRNIFMLILFACFDTNLLLCLDQFKIGWKARIRCNQLLDWDASLLYF